MTSTLRGEGGVSQMQTLLREVAWIYYYESDQNADKVGEGVQNSENCVDVI